jgi:hypothetical protein
MRPIFLVALPVVALAGVGLASVDEAPAPGVHQPSIRFAPKPEAPLTRISQASSKCSTSAGICFVPPLPVGSPCSCGNFSGVIVP